jgi:hypothetical protein
VFNLGGSPVAIADWIAAIEDIVPEARGLISAEPAPLPFPSDIEHTSLSALGDVPVTPFRDAIAETADIYRRLQAEGRLVGAEQGVPAASPQTITA